MMPDAERHVGLALQRVGEFGGGGIVAIDLVERAFGPEAHGTDHGLGMGEQGGHVTQHDGGYSLGLPKSL